MTDMSNSQTQKINETEAESSSPEPGVIHCPVVGIGASAGGLEAIENLLASVPPGDGNAWVVIQHLQPQRPCMLAEILQKSTQMPVREIDRHTVIAPGHVYVIPPSKEVVLRGDRLCLTKPGTPHGFGRPIDTFFTSLAAERGSTAAGIILSGMGDDGTVGLLAIRSAGGYGLVQLPETAQFDAMPNSAIAAGLADAITPAGELAAALAHLRCQVARRPVENPAAPIGRQHAFEQICGLLSGRTGHDFFEYKKSTVYRRIERRMAVHQIADIAAYVDFLHTNPQEIDLLFKELLIGVTSFFRDPSVWQYLMDKAIPTLIASRPPGTTLRAWVAGCSTGEEAYSLAIAFREVTAGLKPAPGVHLQIFATDLDPDAITCARQGRFPAAQMAGLPPALRARYFNEEDGSFRICKEIREMLIFAPQNIIMDPPFTRLDLLSCRNLLIYLGVELQRKLLPIFHYSLKPGGLLLLGSAESLGPYGELFDTLDSKSRLYCRGAMPLRPTELEFPTRYIAEPASVSGTNVNISNPVNLQELADQLLLQKFAPAAVLVNGEGDILFIHGRTGKYLEPAAGKANWNIHVMAKEGLRQEIALALPKAVRNLETVTVRQLAIGSNGSTEFVDLTIYPGDGNSALQGMAMVVFHDVLPPIRPARRRKGSASDARITDLELALQQANEEIQSIREEMQSSHEELKSANEELQSTNEELQSTNEELTTSKEEMQSLNEELQTVNAELQAKVDELSAANSDMKNLLNSTDIATVFLDNQLHVRRFTNQATRIFKLISGDVGRPLSDIVSDLNYPELREDAQEVLRTLSYSEKQRSTQDGRWYVVKIMPYRTIDNVIDGVVITFIDISEAKHLEEQLRAARANRLPLAKE